MAIETRTLSRRAFVAGLTSVAVAAACPARASAYAGTVPRIWRGLLGGTPENLSDGICSPTSAADAGFNFIRLSLPHPGSFEKAALHARLRALQTEAMPLGVHLCLGVDDRAPSRESWHAALRDSIRRWDDLAEQFAEVPGDAVSFHLTHRPPVMPAHDYRDAVARLVHRIRRVDPARMIVCSGRSWGYAPPVELAGLDVCAAVRPVHPFQLTPCAVQPGESRSAHHNHTPDSMAPAWTAEALELFSLAAWRTTAAARVPIAFLEIETARGLSPRLQDAWMHTLTKAAEDREWGYARQTPIPVRDTGSVESFA